MMASVDHMRNLLIIYGIIWREWYMILSYNLTIIAYWSNIMHSHTCLRFSSSLYSLMHMMAPHTFTPVFRQEGRVEINHLMGIGVDEIVGYQWQPPRQHDKTDIIFLEQW